MRLVNFRRLSSEKDVLCRHTLFPLSQLRAMSEHKSIPGISDPLIFDKLLTPFGKLVRGISITDNVTLDENDPNDSQLIHHFYTTNKINQQQSYYNKNNKTSSNRNNSNNNNTNTTNVNHHEYHYEQEQASSSSSSGRNNKRSFLSSFFGACAYPLTCCL